MVPIKADQFDRSPYEARYQRNCKRSRSNLDYRTSSFGYRSGQQCVLTSETDDAGITKKRTPTMRPGILIPETVGGTGVPSGAERISTWNYIPTQGQFPAEMRNSLNHLERTSWDGRFGAARTITGPNNLTSVIEYDTLGRKIKDTPVSALPAITANRLRIRREDGMCWDNRSVYITRSTSSDGSQNFHRIRSGGTCDPHSQTWFRWKLDSDRSLFRSTWPGLSEFKALQAGHPVNQVLGLQVIRCVRPRDLHVELLLNK